MSTQRLYQKKHGLPGLPLTAGTDGVDGTAGNNVWFGYVYDFFDYTEIEIDNIARIAQRGYSSGYYTGIYDKPEGNENDVFALREELNVTDEPKNTNIFSRITDANIKTDDGRIFEFRDYFEMSYSKKVSPEVFSNENYSYTKVDTNYTGLNKDGLSDPWNNRDSQKEQAYLSPWHSIPAAFGEYPYDDVNNWIYTDSSARIMPGRNLLPVNSGFDLFSVISNGLSYTFADSNSHYDGMYESFWYDGKDTSISSPSIDLIKNWVSNASAEGPVDYLKYSANVKDKVIVPDRLSSNVKAGDVLYFYTNKELFQKTDLVEYMVVITRALERCTYDLLIAAAVLTNPFTFKYSDERVINSDAYVYTTGKVVSGFYGETGDSSDSSFIDAYGKNYTNMLSYMSGSSFNMGNLLNKTYETGATVKNEMMHFLQRGTPDSSFVISSQHSETEDHNTIIFEALRLRIPSAVVRQWNVGNVESQAVASPLYIRLDSVGYAYTLTENDFNYSTNTFTLKETRYLKDTSYEDYRCGLDIVIYNQKHYDIAKGSFGYDAINRKYVFNSSDDKKLKIDTNLFGKTTGYDIVFWVTDVNRIRRYSRHTRAEYNALESIFYVSVLPIAGYGTDKINYDYNEQEVHYTDFNVSGISADLNSDAFIEIYVPEDAKNVKIYMNSDEFNFSSKATVSNNWCKAQPDFTEGNYYKVSLDIASNIPTVNGVIPTMNVGGKTVTITTAKDFNHWSGAKSPYESCEVFNALLSGKTISSETRTVTFTAEFDLGEKHISESTNVTQPGYIDNRRMPKANLVMRKDLNRIELANQLKNGVMSNQFQFFIDVDITDFEQQMWGSFSDDDDITLNIEIKNCDSDYEMIRKYIIQQAKKTSTLHINNVQKENTNKTDLDENYFRIRTYLVGAEITDPESVSQKELDESCDYVCNTLKIGTIDETVTRGVSAIPFPNTDKYYRLDLASEQFVDINDRESGLNDSITINLENIRFSDVSDNKKFRIRVLTEFGNPVFSKLFFRFYVSQMYVKYKYNGGESLFYVGSDVLAKKEEITSNLNIYNYMFATETLNAFICPVSYIAIPSLDKMDKAAMDDVVKKEDAPYQITTAIKRHVPGITYPKTRDERNARYINQEMGWFDFSVNTKYFQDNVRDISVRPVNLKSIVDVISENEVFFRGNRTLKDVESRRDETNYLALLYDSRFYDRRKHLDTFMFTYGGTDFEARRYSQVYEKTPIFTYQEATQVLREDKLYNSVRSWNKLYALSGKKDDGLFSGHVSSYGNGYMFITGNYDYDAYAIYSVSDTQKKNDVAVPEDNRVNSSAPFYQVLCQPDNELYAQPRHNNWFRRLLYQAEWWYPQYYIEESTNLEKVKPYCIVPGGKILIGTSNSSIPYNLLYSIYPRCAQNYDDDALIVFMLRCPNIGDEDHNYQTEQDDMTLDILYERKFFNIANVLR